MNKNQVKMVRYGQLVNKVIEDTEAVQETMSPKFQALKDAIVAGTVADVAEGDYANTLQSFTAGTAQYQGFLAQLQGVAAPARLMGNHKLLCGAYAEFVAGCEAMVAALHNAPAQLDEAAFSAAEADQDVATDKLMKYLQKISALI
ncbi:hypothetical protein [Lacticaseibacillus suihuaensis]